VVNPFGVAEPTVGWKRAPLSAVALHLVFSDKYLCPVFQIECSWNACSWLYTHEWFLYRSVCLVCLIGKGGCMLILVWPYSVHIYIYIYIYIYMNKFRF
jgi:hypothetical protein